jgi:hypothetical protein
MAVPAPVVSVVVSDYVAAGDPSWETERTILRGLAGQEFRRHTGYAGMAEHPAPRRRAIPRLLWRRSRRELDDCRRVGRRYLRWHDWPLVQPLLLAARALEIPGMLDAPRRREAIPRTTYL